MLKRKSRVALASDSEGSMSSDEDKHSKRKRADDDDDEDDDDDDDDDATSDSGDEWGTKGSRKKTLTKRSSPRGSNDSDNDSEGGEEGEISDEDSDADSDISEEFNDGYDENLMGDEEDQARLAKMTEMEREQEIFNRIEKRERLKARFEIEKKLRQAKKKQESKEKKQTDVSIRSKERKKNLEGKQDKKSQAIQSLKAEREKKKKAEEERKEKDDVTKDGAKKLKASDIYSDDDSSDSDSDSDASSKRASRSRSRSGSRSQSRSSSRSRSRSSSASGSESASSRHSEEKMVYVNSKEQISQIRLSRFRLEQWLFTPFFAKTVVGCYVRIGIGNSSGLQIYRIAEIIDVVETPKVYQLGKNRTNKSLRLKIGKDEKLFRIEYISNQDFTDAEFNKWMELMGVDNLTLPTMSFIEKKKKDVEAAKNHSWSANDINHTVEEKKKFKRNPHNYAMAKTEVMKKKEMAEQLGDLEEVRKWAEELDRLEDRAKELDKQRTSTISAIAYINERNRHKNIVDIEKAILEEAKKNKFKADDPFTRRKCAPSLVTKKTGGNEKMTSEHLKTLEDLKKKDEERRKADEEKQKKDVEDAKKKKDHEKAQIAKNGEDLFSAHDFDIKIDLDSSIPSAPVSQPVRSSIGSGSFMKDSAPKRSLNLEEYKKKRGLI